MYSNLVENLLLPAADRVLGLSISSELSWWRDVQWYSADKLRLLQEFRLDKLLNQVELTIPYYQEILKKNKIAGNRSPYERLGQLPILTKSIIKENISRLLDPEKEKYIKVNTSGSSGERGTFYQDREAYSGALAIQSMFWDWAGFRLGDRAIQNGITPERGFVKAMKDLLMRVTYLPAYSLDKDFAIKALMSSQKGKYSRSFLGYASGLYTYAKFSQEAGIQDLKFKTVVSWGDKLFPQYRNLIKKQFKCDVFDTYGSSEGLVIASECEHHTYHIMTPHVHVEILNAKGEEVGPGEMGNVIVTRLDNYLMPLLRYKLGDLAIKACRDRVCPCGRNFPVLGTIIGRDTDIIYTPRKKALIVHFFTGIFEHVLEIKQFQIVNRARRPMLVKYIPNQEISKNTIEVLREKICERAKEEFPIEFEMVSRIKPSASGKPQIIVQE